VILECAKDEHCKSIVVNIEVTDFGSFSSSAMCYEEACWALASLFEYFQELKGDVIPLEV
jgi:hypothetical protein